MAGGSRFEFENPYGGNEKLDGTTVEYDYTDTPTDDGQVIVFKVIGLDKADVPKYEIKFKIVRGLTTGNERAPALPKPGELITAIQWSDLDGHAVASLTGIAVKYGDFITALTSGDSDTRYAFYVGLANGKTTVLGSAHDDRLEVGEGGGAIVNGYTGDDNLYVWHQKNVTFYGGNGNDRVIFEPQQGFVNTPAKGIVADLAAGTGNNPFGGTLKLVGIEGISGTARADTISGNTAANDIVSNGGADHIAGRAGDDTITVGSNFDGTYSPVHVSGGAGSDLLVVRNYGSSAVSKLDLSHPETNTGVFAGSQVTGFEKFTLLGLLNTYAFDVQGSGAAELFRTSDGSDTINGGGGNDTLMGMGGADHLDGGGGRDTVSYAFSTAVTVNLATGAASGGEAEGDSFSHVENLAGSRYADRLTGNAGANTLGGGDSNDTLAGGAGDDQLRGGLGSDLMTGGKGDDRFVYASRNEAGDTVTGFSSNAADNDDSFVFSGKAFGKLAAGSLADGEFQSGTAAVAATADIRFFYETDTHVLRFDADGSGAALAIVIATLENGDKVTADNIVII